jgi:hypothetical protein
MTTSSKLTGFPASLKQDGRKVARQAITSPLLEDVLRLGRRNGDLDCSISVFCPPSAHV